MNTLFKTLTLLFLTAIASSVYAATNQTQNDALIGFLVSKGKIAQPKPQVTKPKSVVQKPVLNVKAQPSDPLMEFLKEHQAKRSKGIVEPQQILVSTSPDPLGDFIEDVKSGKLPPKTAIVGIGIKESGKMVATSSKTSNEMYRVKDFTVQLGGSIAFESGSSKLKPTAYEALNVIAAKRGVLEKEIKMFKNECFSPDRSVVVKVKHKV